MSTVDYFEFPVDNIDRAQKFYSEIFGWSFEAHTMEDGTEYVFIHTRDNAGKKAMPGGMYLRKKAEHVPCNYINVEDIEQTLATIQSLGGKVFMQKTEMMDSGYIAICQDPEQNVFGLWQARQTEPAMD